MYSRNSVEELPGHITPWMTSKLFAYTVKPVLSDHILYKIYFLLFRQVVAYLLYESSAESSCSFLHYFHSAISSHLSIGISMSPEWMVAKNRLNCKYSSNCHIASFRDGGSRSNLNVCLHTLLPFYCPHCVYKITYYCPLFF